MCKRNGVNGKNSVRNCVWTSLVSCTSRLICARGGMERCAPADKIMLQFRQNFAEFLEKILNLGRDEERHDRVRQRYRWETLC